MQELIDRFTAWAQDQPDIRAGVILGSRARSEMPADSLSDLDLLVIARDPLIYLSNVSWLLTFGEPGLTFVESTAVGDFRERRVIFKDGRDVDFSVVPAAAIQQMLDEQVPVEIADVFPEDSKFS